MSLHDRTFHRARRRRILPSGQNQAIGSRADESLEIGRRAYLVPGTNTTLHKGDSLARKYERANLPLVTDRLARSGVRLASLLNEVLK